jgi:hypothetical protein
MPFGAYPFSGFHTAQAEVAKARKPFHDSRFRRPCWSSKGWMSLIAFYWRRSDNRKYQIESATPIVPMQKPITAPATGRFMNRPTIAPATDVIHRNATNAACIRSHPIRHGGF